MKSSSLRWKLKISSFALFLYVFLTAKAFGAACCGGSANYPALITGDDRAQFTSTLSYGGIDREADVNGSISNRSANDSEQSQTFRLDAATLVADRFQVGVTIPVTRRYRSRNENSASSTGVGDIAATLGYEFLPEWSYSSWRPKGIVFFQSVFPTGGSTYDATELYWLDSRGKGFFQLSGGVVLLKSWNTFDSSFLLEGHRSLARSLSKESGEFRLAPGWGGSGVLGLGWSPGLGSFRIGASLAYTYEDPVTTSGAVDAVSSATTLWTPALQASYMVSSDFSMSLSYSDQTILGGAQNTSLTRSMALLIQKRWDR